MKSIKIKFWGVRGSIPTPGPETIHYGGNTSCVEVQFNNGPLYIMDAGSGIRELGKELLKRKDPVEAYIFISHFHWDHIQGLPFFRPAFKPKNTFTIMGSDDTSLDLDQIISFQMDPTYFPIAIEDMHATINFRPIREETFSIDGVETQTIYLNHPGYALGYRLTYNGRSVVYISDNEPFNFTNFNNAHNQYIPQARQVEDMFDNFVENKEDRLIQFCKNADILIHDTQFFPDEYQDKVTWGHSPYNYTADLAVKSRVKQLILFHHDPDHDDKRIKEIENLCKQILNSSGTTVECVAARERMVIEI